MDPGSLHKGGSVDMSWDGLMSSVGSFDNVDLSGIMEVVQDNIETVKSVSTWSVHREGDYVLELRFGYRVSWRSYKILT